MTENKLRISFPSDGMDAKTLSDILKEVNASLKAISKAGNLGTANIRIYPFKQGSFEFVVQAVTYSTMGYATIKGLTALFKEVLEIRKIRKELSDGIGKKNNLPSVIINNRTVNVHIDGLLKSIGKDDLLNGFTIKDDETGSVLISVDRNDIKGMLENNPIAEKEYILEDEYRTVANRLNYKDTFKSQEVIRGNEVVKLLKLPTKKSNEWKFIYENIEISAIVTSERDPKYKEIKTRCIPKSKVKDNSAFSSGS